MSISRRDLLTRSLLGAGAVSLRALATGVPAWLLTDPLNIARAQAVAPKRSFILATSRAGDPFNANVPGMYGNGLANIVHPDDPAMAPTTLRLGDVNTTAAKPWADLPQNILNRTVFIHHSTYTNSHPNHPKVLRLMGSTNRNEMIVSALAKRVAADLGSTQTEPVGLGSTVLSFEGRALSRVPPTALRQVLGNPNGPLGDLQSLRDADVDRLFGLYKQHGTPQHMSLLDRFAQTRNEARSISESLLSRLDAIDNNNTGGQIQAAAILAAMNLSPVMTLQIPFGGDNHRDNDLSRETSQTISGVNQFRNLVQAIDSLRSEGVLKQEVIVGSLNVFGRTLSIDRKGRNGRDHNNRHHVTMLIGDSIKPGIVGGVEKVGRDWGATGFNSNTGASTNSGDVPYNQTFEAVAKTIGAAMGVGETELDEDINGGRIIRAALA